MKKIFLLIPVFLLAIHLQGQDEAIYNHFYQNPLLINPGSAGYHGEHQLNLHFRGSWTGFAGAPRNYGLSYNGAFGQRNGLGLMFLSETAGELSRLRFQGNYAYRFQTKDWKWGVGLSAEYHSTQLNNAAVNAPGVEPNDEVIAAFADGQRFFDASVGMWASNDQFTFGLSLPNLVRYRLSDDKDAEDAGVLGEVGLLYASYKYMQPGSSFSLEPIVLLRKGLNSPFLTDLVLKGTFADGKLIGGVSYRAGADEGAGGMLLGVNLSGFNVLYSYEVGFQRFQRYNNGTHEITLGYRFGKKMAAASPDAMMNK